MAFSNDEDLPVTVDVMQRVKPGCEAEFEEVLSNLIATAKTFEGYLGANVFRSQEAGNSAYRIVFKFDRLSHLHRWENSPIRQQWLARAERLTVGTRTFHVVTGLETWFTLVTQQAILPPPRYKMVIVTFLAIFPVLNLLNWALRPLLGDLPGLLRSFVVTLLLMLISTYVVMPRLTRLLARWLYPKA
ncbi:MAG: antibiotic biosynthesis monooxygenase [Scytolyngbya sp. HA4215-MV1]|jgi:hypothetical protein|nr:antibiotic biosynthesis monooxygenase [Scytolyngbya sp. HA4215-MV1]